MKQYSLLRLLPYLQRYRRQLLLGCLMVLMSTSAGVAIPWVIRRAIDTMQAEDFSGRILLTFAGLILLLSALEGIFRFLMRRIMIGVSRYIEFDLRNDLFRHLQRLSVPFYQSHPTGDLMARATNDLSAVRAVLGPGIMYSVNTLFTALLAVSVLMTISPRLGAVTLAPLVLVSLSVTYFGRRIHQRFERIQEQFSWLTTLAQENVSGMRVVKAYNQEEAFSKRFSAANDEYLTRSLALVKIWGAFQPLLSLLLGLSLVGLIWFGGRQVVQNTISLGDFVAFIAYLSMLTWPTIALGFVINLFERGSASMSRINQLFDARPEVFDSDVRELPEITGEIEFRNLDFSYNGIPALSNVTFRVPAGSTVAIVGRTGSGKSTLVNLLCRLQPVPDGTIFIDGEDVNRIPLDQLRRTVGYAPQEALLFSDTIRGNIAFGRPSAQQEEIERVAAASNILPDVEGFPEKFETFVGERGITLSGGQKQRVTISRALLVTPRILILDDSLSAVDTETEEKILTRLDSHLKGRTALIVSHRVSTIKRADRIIVLEQGRVAESGTHEELLELGGLYAELHRKQLLREELGLAT